MPPGSPSGFNSFESLVEYLTRLNAEWTVATRRISPKNLVCLLAITGDEVAQLVESANPSAPATFAVSWAGESESLMWFDIAREYTERWHHQRQIALAVGRPTPIDCHRLYHPVLDTFMRALPYTYEDVDAPDGTLVGVTIEGEAGGNWFIRRSEDRWSLLYETPASPTARVVMSQSDAWRLFTKRMDRATARDRFPAIRIEGDVDLSERALKMVSIMA